MKILIKNEQNEVLISKEGDEKITLGYNQAYNDGDKIVFESDDFKFVKIEVDSHIVESVVYLPEGLLEYAIPVGEKKEAYHPETFTGSQHEIKMCVAGDETIKERRNLALNGLDKRGDSTCFPHSDANIVTRDEPWFESRNAIDGYKDTKGHGPFPFQSWGGGLRDDLEFRLYFGREVLIDEVIIYLRADYKDDHDINWESGIIEFSDGTTLPIKMIKTIEGQSFTFGPKKVTWIKLNHLRREISAAFSALIQIEVFGKEA